MDEGKSAVSVKHRRSAITLLMTMVMLGVFPLDVLLPSFPALAEHFRTTPADIAFSVSLFAIGLAFSLLLVGPLSDVIGRKSCCWQEWQSRLSVRRVACCPPTTPGSCCFGWCRRSAAVASYSRRRWFRTCSTARSGTTADSGWSPPAGSSFPFRHWLGTLVATGTGLAGQLLCLYHPGRHRVRLRPASFLKTGTPP